jgi:hypothetical protein
MLGRRRNAARGSPNHTLQWSDPQLIDLASRHGAHACELGRADGYRHRRDHHHHHHHLVIVVILALIGMGSYNGFVKSRNLIQEELMVVVAVPRTLLGHPRPRPC